MVIELHLRLSKETETGLHNFQLAASVPVLLPLGAGRAAALRGPLLAVLLTVFLGDLLLAFCHSRLECLSLGPGSLVTSSTNGQYKVCLLSAKYCRQMYVLGRHRQM